jgi:hypothetical protein
MFLLSHNTTIMISAATHCLLTHHCLMFHPLVFTDSSTPTCNIPCLPKYEQLLPATFRQQWQSFVIHYFAFQIPCVEIADPCSINTSSTFRKLKAFYKIHHKSNLLLSMRLLPLGALLYSVQSKSMYNSYSIIKTTLLQ